MNTFSLYIHNAKTDLPGDLRPVIVEGGIAHFEQHRNFWVSETGGDSGRTIEWDVKWYGVPQYDEELKSAAALIAELKMRIADAGAVISVKDDALRSVEESLGNSLFELDQEIQRREELEKTIVQLEQENDSLNQRLGDR